MKLKKFQSSVRIYQEPMMEFNNWKPDALHMLTDTSMVVVDRMGHVQTIPVDEVQITDFPVSFQLRIRRMNF